MCAVAVDTGAVVADVEAMKEEEKVVMEEEKDGTGGSGVQLVLIVGVEYEAQLNEVTATGAVPVPQLVRRRPIRPIGARNVR
ncbi:hypothetical protein SprV_0802644700 [Sparganum proliferum]